MTRSKAYAAILVLAALAPSCSAKVGRERQVPATPTAPSATAGAAPAASGTRWSSTERSNRIDEKQGDPLRMAAGQRCTVYRRLPSLSFGVSTLVEDACLEIVSDTTVEVRNGATLVMVATNGLRVGRNVRFNAKGAGGNRGSRSPFANVRREIDTDAEIQALCLERGNRCPCPPASLEAIQGRPGAAGSAGGNVFMVVGELVLSDKLNAFASDVSGGQGGPPGDSGTQECRRGEVHCSSPSCSAGTTFGAPGPTGKVVVAIAGGASAAAIARLGAHTTPAGALTVEETGPLLLERAAELDREAMQKGWQRRAGREP